MREIKFRGRTKDGEWKYGDYIGCDYTCFHPYIKGREMLDGEFYSAEGMYEVEPNTIGQYVGKDRRSKNIYEGDIVKDIYDKKFEVVYMGFSFRLKPLFKYAPYKFGDLFHWVNEEWNDLEVIGNIHDKEVSDGT